MFFSYRKERDIYAAVGVWHIACVGDGCALLVELGGVSTRQQPNHQYLEYLTAAKAREFNNSMVAPVPQLGCLVRGIVYSRRAKICRIVVRGVESSSEVSLFAVHEQKQTVGFSSPRVQVVRIRREAFPLRLGYAELYRRFRYLSGWRSGGTPAPSRCSEQQAREMGGEICDFALDPEDFQLGSTKVFLK